MPEPNTPPTDQTPRKDLFHEYFFAAVTRTILNPNHDLVQRMLVSHLEGLLARTKPDKLTDAAVSGFISFVKSRNWADRLQRKEIIQEYCSLSGENPGDYYYYV